MKLQASRPISPKTLQSQTNSQTKNRLAISRLGILHGRLMSEPAMPLLPSGQSELSSEERFCVALWSPTFNSPQPSQSKKRLSIEPLL